MSESDQIKAELERLRAENAALKKTSSRGLSLKVSEKGALSVYGLGRFPVTLYKEQWNKLLDMTEDLRAFITKELERVNSTSHAQSLAASFRAYFRYRLP